VGGAVIALTLFLNRQKVQVVKEPTIVRVPTAIITPAGVHNTTYNYNVRAGIESGGIQISHTPSNPPATPQTVQTPTAPQITQDGQQVQSTTDLNPNKEYEMNGRAMLPRGMF